MLRPIAAKFRDPVFVLLVIFISSTFLFIGLWSWTLYGVRRDSRLLNLELQAHIKDREARDKAYRAEFDRIYQTLYSSPEEVVPVQSPNPRKPSSVELWQRNRDKELRDRINRLEKWRMTTDSQLRELR